MVYILDFNNKPIMPTERHGHVRKLLQKGRASVVRRTPFTVRLNYKTSSYVQDVSLGVDAGAKHIGVSATTSQKELFASEVILRTDITDLLSTGREQRRNKLRYRKPRFDNRRRLDGTKIHPGVSYKKLVLLEKRKNFLITKEGKGAIPSSSEDEGILAQVS